ncbi:MAG: sulfite oxidase [Saprospiraceae bacterium]
MKIKGSSNRRKFLKNGSLTALSLALGMDIVFGNHLPKNMLPVVLEASNTVNLPDKHPEMTVLNDRPINAEAPPHLLDEALTSSDRFFVRNNGIPPQKSSIDLATWTLTIEGESAIKSKTYTFKELQSKFKNYTYQLTLECGGNGRKEFNPPAKGNQWSTGAVGCAAWTGVRLKDVLADVGVKSDAVYIGYYGKDTHLSGDPAKNPISRGVPISKAMEDESLIAWSMNGEALPYLNGYPLRLVFGGFPASCSGKWLHKIVIRNKVHDGAKMAAPSYRVPCKPVPPGTKVPNEEMCIIESMPVKSLITFPKMGATIQLGQTLPVSGHAWAGNLEVKKMQYSIDFGSTWQTCQLTAPANRLAWQQFSTNIKFPKKGYYEIWARATDSEGKAQPMVLPGWNPKGYLNNACHRIAVKIV